MKRCPQCDRIYTDDNLNFCLSDGTQLSVENDPTSEPTVVMQPAPPVKKKSRLLLWLGSAVLLIFIVSSVLGALLLFRVSRMSDANKAEKQNGVSLPTTPTVAPKPKSTPTPSSTPSPEPTKKADDTKQTTGDGADDTSPIGWDTAANGFKGESGRTYKFECPAGGKAEAIWGSDIYADYSSICTAAVHAGLFSLEDGGEVTIEYRPGRAIYGSTVRNGIKSNTAGDNGRSFVVRKAD